MCLIAPRPLLAEACLLLALLLGTVIQWQLMVRGDVARGCARQGCWPDSAARPAWTCYCPATPLPTFGPIPLSHSPPSPPQPSPGCLACLSWRQRRQWHPTVQLDRLPWWRVTSRLAARVPRRHVTCSRPNSACLIYAGVGKGIAARDRRGGGGCSACGRARGNSAWWAGGWAGRRGRGPRGRAQGRGGRGRGSYSKQSDPPLDPRTRREVHAGLLCYTMGCLGACWRALLGTAISGAIRWWPLARSLPFVHWARHTVFVVRMPSGLARVNERPWKRLAVSVVLWALYRYASAVRQRYLMPGTRDASRLRSACTGAQSAFSADGAAGRRFVHLDASKRTRRAPVCAGPCQG